MFNFSMIETEESFHGFYYDSNKMTFDESCCIIHQRNLEIIGFNYSCYLHFWSAVSFLKNISWNTLVEPWGNKLEALSKVEVLLLMNYV